MKIGPIGAGAWAQNHLRVWKRLGVLAAVYEADDVEGDASMHGVVIATDTLLGLKDR